MAGFSEQLALLVEKAKGDVQLVHRKVCLDLYRSLVLKSPVGNPDLWKHPRKGYVGGRFRANWQVGVGSVNATTTEDIDPSGEAAIAKAEGALSGVKVGGTIFLTNSLPYARPLEYGHSKQQAPGGMVRITVAEYAQYLAKAVGEVKQ